MPVHVGKHVRFHVWERMSVQARCNNNAMSLLLSSLSCGTGLRLVGWLFWTCASESNSWKQ